MKKNKTQFSVRLDEEKVKHLMTLLNLDSNTDLFTAALLALEEKVDGVIHGMSEFQNRLTSNIQYLEALDLNTEGIDKHQNELLDFYYTCLRSFEVLELYREKFTSDKLDNEQQ
ncbi:hypothetical protein BKI52_32965 [marine bacterium AO1-C]|nr:hypothetical protein BKI52_32965 [marine bacterium AO1-C]